MDTLPAAPPTVPTTPPKHMAHWKIVVLTAVVEFVVLGVIGAATDIGKEPTVPVAVPSIEVPTESSGITADMVVDTIKDEKIIEFCTQVALVNDDDAALAAFSEGYTADEPSAEEVFNELLTRC